MAIENYAPPTSPYIDIIYQDDVMVVLNKPSGLLSVPGKAPEHKDSLERRVQSVYPSASIVHRLDMATSGVMVMALTKAAQRHINQQFAERKTAKSYLANVYGWIEQDHGSVDLPLICDWPNRPKQMVCYQHGKAALTHYHVLERSHTPQTNMDTPKQEQVPYTAVQLTPITGRSHQLRVHMLSLGHPILGDRLYAHPQALAMATRLQLHAQSLTLTHPTNEQKMTFNSPCPF